MLFIFVNHAEVYLHSNITNKEKRVKVTSTPMCIHVCMNSSKSLWIKASSKMP